MVIESKNGNLYYFSKNKKQILNIHPIMKKFIQLRVDNSKFDNLNEILLDNGCNELSGFSKEEIDYYYEFFCFLNKNRYFDDPYYESLDEVRNYNAIDVESSLANTEQISFEVTDSCNLKCIYCGYGEFYHGYDIRKEKKINFDDAKALLDYVVQFKRSARNTKIFHNISVSFYGGEPLLNFDFIERMVRCICNIELPYNKFVFHMTTNGVLLDKYIDFLIEHDFSINISIDGDRENNSYRIFRNGAPSYDAVIKNIRFVKKYNTGYFDKKVNFISVIHSRNEQGIVRENLKKIFNKEPIFINLSTAGVISDRKLEFEESLINKIKTDDENADLEVGGFLNTYCETVFSKTTALVSGDNCSCSIATGTCHPFEKRIFMTVNGKILPCERIPHKYGLGWVSDKKVNLDFDQIAKTYNSLYRSISERCNACRRGPECKVCIFQIENGKCTKFLNKKQFDQRVGKIIELLDSGYSNGGALSWNNEES